MNSDVVHFGKPSQTRRKKHKKMKNERKIEK